ncbi:unnamed protein product [Schistosoma turkestanicum]|nr:unnamed protein product [Schistosoma turkestanicum]
MRKKTRFLWIRDLPAKCKDADLRNVLERHAGGSIQKIRLFKQDHLRHAIVTFVDIKSAAAVINTENKINDSLLKMEYCSSSDALTTPTTNTNTTTTMGIINHNNNNNKSNSNNTTNNSHRNTTNNTVLTNSLSTFNHNNTNNDGNNNSNNNNNSDRKTEKELMNTNMLHKGSNDSLPNNDQLGRGPLIFKRTTNHNSNSNNNHSNNSNNNNHNTSSNIIHNVQLFNQVLRPVQQSSTLLTTTTTTHMSNSYRGLKISDLPPSSKLSDNHLRQSLFTEFRRCGRIQSVVVLSSMNNNNNNGSTNTTRLAIVTFRRAEEAECAYQAIQSGAKLLFSTPVSVELHPGSNALNSGFYVYGLYVVHIFPPCDFSHAQLGLAAPDLHRRVVQANQSHLLVVITTV